jgi:cardiolipin synthase
MIAFTAVIELVILNSEDNVDVKLTWAVVVAVLPLLGAVLYGFIRFDLGNRVNRKLINTSIISSQPFIPENPSLYETVKEQAPELYPIAHYLAEHAGAPAFTNTDVTYYPLGEVMFESLLAELEKAEKFIFMEYFLVSEGHMWNSILDILERKAAEGVEIRFLYDGMNAFTNLPYQYPAILAQKGIHCKMHAPVRPFVSTHYNNRDHRKITVIDGHTAFTGGINLEDRYINIDSPYGHWKDTAVMLKGDAVRGFTLLFLQMWNATEREHCFAPYLTKPENSHQSQGYVIPYGDVPMDRENVGELVYLNMINQAKDYLYIMTPYLIPDEKIITALQFAAKRGVDIRLILPGISDMKATQVLARSYYRRLSEDGVKIYEYTPGFVHGKVFLCDDIHAVVGTINLDYRSLRHHFECAAYLYRLPVLNDIKEDFHQTQEKCRRIYPEDIHHYSRFSRVAACLLRFAAPLL